MIKLLGHYFKKRLHILIIISVILVLLHLVIYGGDYIIESTGNHGYGEYKVLYPNNNPIRFYIWVGIILATIIPIFEFKFKMKKVSVDHFYSLPIKREKLFASKYIIGLIEIMIPLTVLFIYTLLSMIVNKHIFNLKYYFIFYIVSFALITSLYSINTFAFSKCNKTIDGILNMVLYTFLFVTIYYVFWYLIAMLAMVFNLADKIEVFLDANFYLLIPHSSMNSIANIFIKLMENKVILNYEYNIVMYITVVLLAIISVVLLIVLSKKEKAENTLDVSDSYFAFKFMIPFFIFALSLLTVSFGLIYAIFLVIVGYILYVIYRRSFKIKKIDIIILASTIFTGLLTGIIGNIIDLYLGRIY